MKLYTLREQKLGESNANVSLFLIADITNMQMAQCIKGEMRERSSSFDLHDIRKGRGDEGHDDPDAHHGHHHHHHGHHGKPNFLSKLFRSISENSMRRKSPSASPATSPKNSPKPGSVRGRRRFVRVIKNDEQIGEEYINPHVVRKYEQGFWESKYMRKSASLDDPPRPLPYTVSGPTILKKAHSVDSTENPASPSGTPPLSAKSCKFNEDVEVIEYDIKGKCLMIMNDAHVSHEKLHEEALYCADAEALLLSAPRGDHVIVEPNDISETNYKLEALEVIDENGDLRPAAANAHAHHPALDDDEEHLLDDLHVEDIKDSVFVSDSSETDSATESCDDCGREKNKDATAIKQHQPRDISNTKANNQNHLNGLNAAECLEDDDDSSSSSMKVLPRPPTPPTPRRQNSDEGISAPMKSNMNATAATGQSAAPRSAKTDASNASADATSSATNTPCAMTVEQ